MKKWLKKKGLSTVVSTMILITISIIAAFIVWGVVKNVSDEQSEFITTEGLTLDVQIANVEIVNDTDMNVQVKRNPGGGEIVGVVFVVYDINNSEVHKKNIPLEELERRNFEITLKVLNTSSVGKITVTPIYMTESGKEIVGSIGDEEKIRNIPTSTGGGGGGEPANEPGDTPDPEPEINTDCDLTSANWSKNLVTEGEEVFLTVGGTNCDGRIISFEVFDKDGPLDSNDLVLTEYLSLTFNENVLCSQCISDSSRYWCPSDNKCKPFLGPALCLKEVISQNGGSCPTETFLNNEFSFVWETIYQEDPSLSGDNNPEYYFVASVTGSDETIESPNNAVDDPLLLTVEPIPATCNDRRENGEEDGVDCGGPDCPACLNLYWEYEGSRVDTMNDVEYDNDIWVVMENSQIEDGTNVDFFIYDDDTETDGEDDYISFVTYYVDFDGSASTYWRARKDIIEEARDSEEGERLELYFSFNGTKSNILDISFVDPPEETCDDGIQNQGEYDIDCGGPNCSFCLNECQECISGSEVWCYFPKGEELFDGDIEFCGADRGVCLNAGMRSTLTCETCTDGVQNQLETGVDCGGPCGPCATCSDNILNQDEFMTDCGGPNCPLCECETGADCTGFEMDCVQGYCQECGPETTGLGCSTWDFPWQQGTCASESDYGNYWTCRNYPMISYLESTGYHYWRFCREGGSICASNKDGDSGGDFEAEGVCVRGTNFYFPSATEYCDTDEVAMIPDGSSYISQSSEGSTEIFVDKYLSDCSEAGDPRYQKDILCDSDVSYPTVGFNWDGICSCGKCQTGPTNPCVENYESLDQELLKQELLDEINWERAWVTGGTGIHHIKMHCYQEYPKDCWWWEYTPRDLILDAGISEASRLHSQDMADNDYIFDKDEIFTDQPSNLDGLTAEERISQAGYDCNIAYEITDRIYVEEGMDARDVVYYLTRGNGGEWSDNIAPDGESVDDNMWFGNRYLEYDGEGNPSGTDYEWYEIYPRFSIRYWVSTGNVMFDTLGIGTARDSDGQLYVTATFCDNIQDDFAQHPIDEDPRCGQELNYEGIEYTIPWCNGDYNNHPHCYDYWSLYKSLGGEEDMTLDQENLRFYCMQWNPFPSLSLNFPDGSEVLIGDVVSIPTTLTFNMRSPLFFEPGDTLTFEIWDKDNLGDDYIETISGVVGDDYAVSIPWNFDQGVVDAGRNLLEGDSFELYFKFLSEQTTELEVFYR